MKLQNAIYADGKRAIIYLRVSTEEQVDNFSLNTQEGICKKEAEKRGYEITEIFREEGKSAKSISGRPTLINLLEYCRRRKNNIQALFVYRIDRISRITADYLAIRKKLAEDGVNIISATEPTGDSPTEKLVETILAGFAQLDNDIRSERTRNGMKARFLAGLMSRKPPLGYILHAGYAVKDPQTWDKVKISWDLMATGTKSLADIAKIMNEAGLREYCRQKEHIIRPQTANRIFRNKFYMGKITSRIYPEEITGQHIPMIAEEQFYKVQAILDGRNTQKLAFTRRTFENKDFPLRRIVKCSKCGVGLTAAWATGRHGGKFAYYWCAGKCNYKCIKVAELEEVLMILLKHVTPKKECLNLFIDCMYKTYYQRQSRLIKIKNQSDTEIARLKELRKTLVEKNLAGIYSDEIFKEQNAMIENKITEAQIAKDDATLNKYNIDAVTSFMKTILADLGETYKRSSIPQLKVLLGSMFTSGLAWNYNGTLNHTISPLYQYIMMFDKEVIPFGSPKGI